MQRYAKNRGHPTAIPQASHSHHMKSRNVIYTHRLQLSISTVLILWLMIVRFPMERDVVEIKPVDTQSEEIILFDEMMITRQKTSPPSPLKPAIPPSPPEDRIIEQDLELQIEWDADLSVLMEADVSSWVAGVEGRLVTKPDRPPRVLKIVEPTVDLQEWKKEREPIVVRVEFMIDEGGEIVEVSVISLAVAGDDGLSPTTPLAPRLQTFVIEAVLEAANQWEFRPALHHGRKVAARSVQTFYL